MEASVAQLREVMQRHGFLYLSNHGVPEPVLEGIVPAMQKFFSLPHQEKMTIGTNTSRVRPKTSRGFICNETLDPTRGADLKEVLDMGRDGTLAAAATPFQGPNNWPVALAAEEFKEPVLRHMQAMWQLAKDMAHAIALSLSLPRAFFDEFIDDPIIIHRLNHYSAHTPVDRSQLSCGEHTDYGFFTLLQQVSGSGDLQVYVGDSAGDSKWVAAPIVPGTLNFNIGDLMEIWSNGLYNATLHRVVAQEPRERMSIAFFFDPNYEAVIEPVPTCVSDEMPRRFKAVQAGPRKLAKFEATWPELEKTADVQQGEGQSLFKHAD